MASLAGGGGGGGGAKFRVFCSTWAMTDEAWRLCYETWIPEHLARSSQILLLCI